MEIRQINFIERELVIGLFDKYRVFYKQPSDINLADDFISSRLKNNESIIFVALFDNGKKKKSVGFAQLYPKYSSAKAVKNWILNDLYVEEEYRKQGIGKQLIATAMDLAKANDARFLQLETAVDNYTAQSLYESAGFIKQEPDKDFFLYRIDVN